MTMNKLSIVAENQRRPAHKSIEMLPIATAKPQTMIESHMREILFELGEDPDREGLQRTPHRVAKMYAELLEGYTQNLDDIVNGALFEADYGDGEMVVVANIEYHSMCEHHMLPFVGKVHVAYLPGDKVIGLSKIPRIVDMFAHRLQIQERMTNEIADAIADILHASGVMVVVEGEHSCARLRGVKKHDVNMVTTAQRGQFKQDRELRNEFYRLIGR
jgi:GTP cyclohydrolase I